ncbi:MAG: hypothetical protein H7A25_05690 [Leptospiraceae bacterium]|nr:hypothetical protein [Leptospiraceae bacterium]MCP5499373.1 hypothetical protein [Leptospiraceae bacterium]
MKKYILMAFFSLSLIFNASAPKKNLKEAVRTASLQLSEKGYAVDPGRFFIHLKKNSKVNYILTPPHYISRTGLAILSEPKAKRFKILIYTLEDKFSNTGKLIFGEVLSSPFTLIELKEYANFYLVEIEMEETSDGEEAMVELVHGFKYPRIPIEIPHTTEGDKPAPKENRLPCYHKVNCSEDRRYNPGFEKKI